MISYLDLANCLLIDLLQLIFPAFSLSHPLLPDTLLKAGPKWVTPLPRCLSRLPTPCRGKNIPSVSEVLWSGFIAPRPLPFWHLLFLLCFNVVGLDGCFLLLRILSCHVNTFTPDSTFEAIKHYPPTRSLPWTPQVRSEHWPLATHMVLYLVALWLSIFFSFFLFFFFFTVISIYSFSKVANAFMVKKILNEQFLWMNINLLFWPFYLFGFVIMMIIFCGIR